MSSKFIPQNKNSAPSKSEPRETAVIKKEYGDVLLVLGQAKVAEEQALNAQSQALQTLARLSEEFKHATERDAAAKAKQGTTPATQESDTQTA